MAQTLGGVARGSSARLGLQFDGQWIAQVKPRDRQRDQESQDNGSSQGHER